MPDAPVHPDAAPSRARHAALALSLAHGVGPVRFAYLVAAHGTAAAALDAALPAAARADALAAADAAREGADRAGAAMLLTGDPDYPPALADLPDPPPVLWLLGDPSLLHRHDRTLAVVGTRRMTPYGERATHALVTAVARAGAVVVSGMALGIDAAAHLAALDADGATVAVLGTGVDVPYPRAHRALHARLAAHGALLSEQPPGARGTPGAFPRRNRLIAALARATLVVEAPAASGAIITADAALDLGRTVAAVPGAIDAGASAGCNRLLRDGATLVADADDALALLGLIPRTRAAVADVPPGLGDDEAAIWRALADPAPDVDTLVAAVALPARRCAAALAMLEIAGAVETSHGGAIRRRA